MTTRLEIQYVPPGTLHPNPWNSNVVGAENEDRLRRAIKRLEFFKPIIVRERADGALEILGGEHRWRIACDEGLAEVPIVNLGRISDRKAKEIGLADNGGYGEDDAVKLGAILKDLAVDGTDVTQFLPYNDDDLAGIFAAEAIDLDDISLDDKDDEKLPELDKVRPTATHAVLRFKVPIEDRERVEKFIDHVVKTQGLKDEDSMLAAGMALVAIVGVAREQM